MFLGLLFMVNDVVDAVKMIGFIVCCEEGIVFCVYDGICWEGVVVVGFGDEVVMADWWHFE